MTQGKYRGKRCDNGEWAYGCKIEYKQYCFIFDSAHGGYIIYADNVAFNLIEVHLSSVSMFTGKLDRNGKEVYGGDKIKIFDDRYTFEAYYVYVIWENYRWKLHRDDVKQALDFSVLEFNDFEAKTRRKRGSDEKA